uniref:Uncharacterized protein n=1 Tax=Timema bartmani TaxID=61472 RepID=A0A7R9FAM8_9NEOP|nr:unnamed protein product [Timema bartmani]
MAILWAVKMTRNVELSININSTWEGCNLTALDVLHIDAQFNPSFHTISTRVFLELLAGCSSVILGKIMLLLIGVVKIGRKVALGMAETLETADTLMSAGNSLPGRPALVVQEVVRPHQPRFQTATDVQCSNIMAITDIPSINTTYILVKVEPHRILNVCKGVVTCFDLDCVSIEEI